MEGGVQAEHTFVDAGIREVMLDGRHFEVDLSPIGLLGKGFQGEVRAAREVATGEVVAAKLMKLDRRALTEAKALSRAQHPFVVRLHGLWKAADRQHCVLLTELCPEGELFDLIIEHEHGLPPHQTRAFFGKIAAAVAHCHSRRVAHRDLKAENVLLDGEGNPKLIDLGLAFVAAEAEAEAAGGFGAAAEGPAADAGGALAGLAQTKVGSLMYAAPEVVNPAAEEDAYDPYAADVWSLGILLYCMLQGLFPFRIAVPDVCPAFAVYEENGTLPWKTPGPPRDMLSALRNLLRLRASERISAHAAATADWLKANVEPPVGPAGAEGDQAPREAPVGAEDSGVSGARRKRRREDGGDGDDETLGRAQANGCDPGPPRAGSRGAVPGAGAGAGAGAGPGSELVAGTPWAGITVQVPPLPALAVDSPPVVKRLRSDSPGGPLGASVHARGLQAGLGGCGTAAPVAGDCVAPPASAWDRCVDGDAVTVSSAAVQFPARAQFGAGAGTESAPARGDSCTSAAAVCTAAAAAAPTPARGVAVGAGDGSGPQLHRLPADGAQDGETAAGGGGRAQEGGGGGAPGLRVRFGDRSEEACKGSRRDDGGAGGGGAGGGTGGGGSGGGTGGSSTAGGSGGSCTGGGQGAAAGGASGGPPGGGGHEGNGGGDGDNCRGSAGPIPRVLDAQEVERRLVVQRICKWVLTHCDPFRDSIVLTDAQGTQLGGDRNAILAVTEAWCNLCGYTEQEAIGRSPRLTQGTGTDQSCIEGMREAIASGRACKVSVVNYRKGGDAFINNLTLCPIRRRGEVVVYTGILRDHSSQLSRLVALRPTQFFKMTTHYTATRPLIARPPATPMVLVVEDDDGIGVESDRDEVWQHSVVEMHVRRLSMALKEREPEYLSLWLQDAFAALNLPYSESVCDADGREVISVHVQHGQLVCRGLVLPVAEPGHHRIVFERLRGDPLAYHRLFKQIASHMQNC